MHATDAEWCLQFDDMSDSRLGLGVIPVTRYTATSKALFVTVAYLLYQLSISMYYVSALSLFSLSFLSLFSLFSLSFLSLSSTWCPSVPPLSSRFPRSIPPPSLSLLLPLPSLSPRLLRALRCRPDAYDPNLLGVAVWP